MDTAKDEILALSIQQPWAELIISGKKSIEIRSWTSRYRGQLWIHAGQVSNSDLEQKFGLSNLFHGGYIGVVTLEEIMPFDEPVWKQWRPLHLDSGDYQTGFYAWILSNPIRFRSPIRGAGKPVLFSVPDEVKDLLKQALKDANPNL